MNPRPSHGWRNEDLEAHPGAMLEEDNVHLTKKTKEKGGREKKCET